MQYAPLGLILAASAVACFPRSPQLAPEDAAVRFTAATSVEAAVAAAATTLRRHAYRIYHLSIDTTRAVMVAGKTIRHELGSEGEPYYFTREIWSLMCVEIEALDGNVRLAVAPYRAAGAGNSQLRPASIHVRDLDLVRQVSSDIRERLGPATARRGPSSRGTPPGG